MSDQNTLQLMLSRRLGIRVQIEFPETMAPRLIIANLDRKAVLDDVSRYRSKYAGVPIIGLSLQHRNLEGVKLLLRPFKVDALISSVKSYLKTSAPALPAASASAALKQQLIRSARSTAICSEYPAKLTLGNTFVEMLYAAYIKSICEQKNVKVTYEKDGTKVDEYGFLESNQVVCKHQRSVIRSLSAVYKNTNSFSFRQEIHDDSSPVTEHDRNNGVVHDSEAFFWELISGCFRHELPAGLSLDTAVRLRRWPNCIGLRYPIRSVVMSSLLHQGAVSINDITSDTGLPPRVVTEFVATAYSLGYVRKESAEPVRTSPGIPDKSAPTASAVSSLVRRVARRLFGSKAA